MALPRQVRDVSKTRVGFINRIEGAASSSVMGCGPQWLPHPQASPSMAPVRLTSFLGSVGRVEPRQALGYELEHGPQKRSFFMGLVGFFLSRISHQVAVIFSSTLLFS